MVDQPRSIANRPNSTAPITVGNRMMRPAASQAARPDPTAMEIEKTARQAVTTSSLPPSAVVTRGGISESATAPTSQNQLVTSAPHNSRGSSRRNFNSPAVETSTLRRTTRSGAPGPVDGMSRLAPQHKREKAIIMNEKWAGSPPPLAATPPTMVPSRIAMNVAPSTNALPAGNSERARWSGRMPYLIGPKSAAMTPNRNNTKNRRGTECTTKPTTARKAMPISANLSRLATLALS